MINSRIVDWYANTILLRLLKLKHWQLFCLLLISIFLSNFRLYFSVDFGIILFYSICINWMYGICFFSFKILNEYEVDLITNKSLTLILLIVVVLSIIFYFTQNTILDIVAIVSGIIAALLFFTLLYITASRLVMIQALRKAELGEIIFKLFQIGLLFPFGVWGLQPLIKKYLVDRLRFIV